MIKPERRFVSVLPWTSLAQSDWDLLNNPLPHLRLPKPPNQQGAGHWTIARQLNDDLEPELGQSTVVADA